MIPLVRAALAALSLASAGPAPARAGPLGEPPDGAAGAISEAPAAAGSRTAVGGWLEGFRFRIGGLYIAPTRRGGPVQLEHVDGMARLSGIHDGPVDGSYATVGSALMPAAVVGWAPPVLGRQLSIETILALPFKQKLYAGGTLASTSLAPSALGSLPTGVPALGKDLGEVTVLPPVVTAVYRFFPRSRVRPYLGAGGCWLIVLDAKITNPILTSVQPPKLEVPNAMGWVAQAGAEVRFDVGGVPLHLTADVKYVGGLDVTAKVKDIWVSLPGLPVYGSARVGDNAVRVKIEPLVSFLGLGVDF